MTKERPTPIRTDSSNAFAHYSMAVRVPNIVQETIERNPDYPPSVKDRLRRLKDRLVEDAPLRLPAPPAPDRDLWAHRFGAHRGDTWLGAEWFFSEMLIYRLMMEACRYWTTLRDPFRPFKQEEMESEALWEALEAACSREGTLEERLAGRLIGTLWGNRIDLSMKNVLQQGTDARDDHLLTNDIPEVVEHLLSEKPGPLHVIMDNAGTEQALDFALVDLLLDAEVVRTVTLHVKMQPVLVSDAIMDDIFRLLDAMDARGGEAGALAQRLRDFVRTDRLQIIPDFFWNTDGRLWELPPRLREPLQEAQLVITKGDVNYRRATNDAIWPAGASLAEAVGDFPAPLLALRTLKSDTLVGVNKERMAELDEQEDDWRTSGTYGVAQFAAKAARGAPRGQ